jgi:hypothetical protein
MELWNLKNWNRQKMLSGADCQLKQNSESESDFLGCEDMKKLKRVSKRNYFRIEQSYI